MDEFSITTATLEDMAFLLEQAQREGWNPGLDDTASFYASDPNGFFIGKLRGEKIGCISAVTYGTGYGFLGFYIVVPQHRGHGWGLKLWRHALDYLGERCIGLDGVVAQQANYKKSHFNYHYRNIRYGGAPRAISSSKLAPISDVPFAELVHYDTAVFGVERRGFLQSWIEMSNAKGLAKVHDGQLVGYGVMRRCGSGYKMGPLFANDKAVAEELFHGLCAFAEEGPVFLDVPEVNPDAIQLAITAGLEPFFETARMYNKEPPQQQLGKVFGVTTFELG